MVVLTESNRKRAHRILRNVGTRRCASFFFIFLRFARETRKQQRSDNTEFRAHAPYGAESAFDGLIAWLWSSLWVCRPLFRRPHVRKGGGACFWRFLTRRCLFDAQLPSNIHALRCLLPLKWWGLDLMRNGDRSPGDGSVTGFLHLIVNPMSRQSHGLGPLAQPMGCQMKSSVSRDAPAPLPGAVDCENSTRIHQWTVIIPPVFTAQGLTASGGWSQCAASVGERRRKRF